MKVAVSAASGLIGSALVAELTAAGTEVVRLVRRRPEQPDEIGWDPLARDGLDPAALRGVDAVVHLSGAPITPGRWGNARKAGLRASRIASTRTLVAAMVAAAERSTTGAAAHRAPGTLVCASGVNFYGDTGDRAVDETGPAGKGFLADLVIDWEAATEPARAAGIRVVNTRSGAVLAPSGGLLGPLLLPFKLGLGAQLGSGKQYLSWISLTDEIRAIRFVLERADLSGPVNLTSPEPVTNAAFTKALAGALHRPAMLRLPMPLLRAALGDVPVELLFSIRVLPAKLTEAGFIFREPDMRLALASVIGTASRATPAGQPG